MTIILNLPTFRRRCKRKHRKFQNNRDRESLKTYLSCSHASNIDRVQEGYKRVFVVDVGMQCNITPRRALTELQIRHEGAPQKV